MTNVTINHTELCNKCDNIRVLGIRLRDKIRSVMPFVDVEKGNKLCSLNIELELILSKIDNILMRD